MLTVPDRKVVCMKDILIFLSDQHSGLVTGYAGDPIVRTPNLDRIAGEGTVFDNAYTSCPLCIPARASFVSSLLPSRTACIDNAGTISSDLVTFMHSLGAAGYETVLCGRIHFEGPDQRHGFMKRIAGDITNVYLGAGKQSNIERGKYAPTLGEVGCLQIIGGGNSPTLEYDRYVIREALAYLSQPHEKPQCLVVGTYAPHFPYVAPPELYDYYLDKVDIPESVSGCDYEHPVYRTKLKDKDPEIIRGARAAYWGMVEFMDQNIGLVYHAWQEYLDKAGREGVFCYLSDHGDQAGERGMYAKKVFFDCSSHIPLLFAGAGVPKGQRITSPVSIMDIGPTLCEMTDAPRSPECDGKSLWQQIQAGEEDGERFVISEYIETLKPEGIYVPGRMIRYQNYKLISYYGYEADDLLFDLSADPKELHNCIKEQPEMAAKLSEMLHREWDPTDLLKRFSVRMEHLAIIRKWANAHPIEEPERWITTPESLDYPEHFLTSSVPMPDFYRKLMGAK